MCFVRALFPTFQAQVVTGLEVFVERSPAPGAVARPIQVHIAKYLLKARRTSADVSVLVWAANGIREELVELGLKCCADEPDDRPEVSDVKETVASILRKVSVCAGVRLCRVSCLRMLRK